jgi:hypothetical protein
MILCGKSIKKKNSRRFIRLSGTHMSLTGADLILTDMVITIKKWDNYGTVNIYLGSYNIFKIQ